jgi:PAS domain S-box-containing protein
MTTPDQDFLSQAQMTECEELFAFALAPMGVGVWSLDLEGQTALRTPDHDRIFGYDALLPEWTLETFLEHVVPEDRAYVERLHDEALSNQAGWSFECRIIRRDGELRWIAVNSRLRVEGGRRRMMGTVHDITERRLAQEAVSASEEKYRSLFNSIDEGFCIVEVAFDGDLATDYRFLDVNPAFEEQTELADAVGRWMRDMLPDHEEHWFETYGYVALTGESRRFQNRAEALGRFYDVNAFRVGEPEQRRVAVLFNDVTEQKRAEEQLRKANNRKDEYMAMLGHELRNPLSAIMYASELIKRDGTDASMMDHAVEVLERQSNHMSRLVDGLLEVSRLAGGKVRLQPVTLNLRELVGDVLSDRAHLAATSDLEICAQLDGEPIWVRVDRVRLAQVVDNLVANSLKFTPAGGSVSVTLSQSSEQAVICVRDTGIGIATDALDQVFDPFHQQEQGIDRENGGLGLGLAVARELIELHGGSIEAHSDGEDTGAEFVIRLALADGPQPAKATSRPATAQSKKILVVEDNTDVAEVLATLLEKNGHEVIVTSTARAGLDVVHRGRADIVVCDIGLPGMSGYEFARALRDDGFEEIPLVALTGYGENDARHRSAQAGFDTHLTKPIDIAALEDVLRRL